MENVLCLSFTGLPQDSLLNTILRSQEELYTVMTIEKHRSKTIQDLKRLQRSLENLNRECSDRSRKQRKSAVETHNRKTVARPIYFTKGDYVLKAMMRNNLRKKTNIRWEEPS